MGGVLKPTEWMTQGELADLLGVTRTTIKNRTDAGTVISGHRIESRDATTDDDVHVSTRLMFRVVTVTQRSTGRAQQQRSQREAAEHEASVAWQRSRREAAEAELDEMRIELRALEQKIEDAEAALIEALQERNTAVEALGNNVPAHAVRDLVNAVWVAIGETEIDDMRDGLLLALRSYVEA